MSISTKDKIIDAAIDLISKNGYAETSVRDIAEKVGIKPSSIYNHFESKEAILNYILDKYNKIVRDDEHRRKWHEEKYSIIAGKANLSAEEIIKLLFFKFDEPHNVQNRKMVKIMCSEAVRNDAVSNHLQNQSNNSFKYIKSVLDNLFEAGKISKCDTAKLAGVLRSIVFAFMHLDSINIQDISEDYEGTDMFSLLEYVLRIAIEERL